MKKGQTEMLGLVIIVILIVIGALFYVRFAILGKKSEEQNKGDLSRAIQAYNMINAIMNVKVCENTMFVRDGFVLCKNNGALCNENNENACDYLDKEIDKIAKNVLYRPYNLNLSSSGWSHETGENCPYGVTSYAYIYTVKGETYKVYLKLC